MMTPEARKEHRWLAGLVGEWTFESAACGEAAEPTAKVAGSETVQGLGALWVVGRSSSEMPGGGTAQMMLTLGYDPDKQRFVGSWVGSMMTNMWVYEGQLDPAGNVLTLDTTGPAFDGSGRMARYQDIITVEDPDRRTLTSRVLGDDGAWTEFMKARYVRRK